MKDEIAKEDGGQGAEDNPLCFRASAEETDAMRRLDDELGGGVKFFHHNVPLQIWLSREEDENGKKTGRITGSILNYMPRKESCCTLKFGEIFRDDMPPKETLKDFCDTTIAVLKNLIRQWESFRDGKQDFVYYPTDVAGESESFGGPIGYMKDEPE